jgi:hypothetical protein
MDGVLANFILMLVASSVAGCVAIIGGVSSCMLKSRCTNIKNPCLSCEREPLDDENPAYNTPINQPVTQTPVINRLY